MYPLTEPQPLAARMQKEFTGEIEAAGPRYVVYVNVASSWLSAVYPGQHPEQPINDWWSGYSQNYAPAGAVDIFEDKPSEFFWDGQLANRTNSSPPTITIYRRK